MSTPEAQETCSAITVAITGAGDNGSGGGGDGDGGGGGDGDGGGGGNGDGGGQLGDGDASGGDGGGGGVVGGGGRGGEMAEHWRKAPRIGTWRLAEVVPQVKSWWSNPGGTVRCSFGVSAAASRPSARRSFETQPPSYCGLQS